MKRDELHPVRDETGNMPSGFYSGNDQDYYQGMDTKKFRLQVSMLVILILLNFVAQIPYFFYLYYKRQPTAESLRSAGVMGIVFLALLLLKRHAFLDPLKEGSGSRAH